MNQLTRLKPPAGQDGDIDRFKASSSEEFGERPARSKRMHGSMPAEGMGFVNSAM
jgi:hypothetical protein